MSEIKIAAAVEAKTAKDFASRPLIELRALVAQATSTVPGSGASNAEVIGIKIGLQRVAAARWRESVRGFTDEQVATIARPLYADGATRRVDLDWWDEAIADAAGRELEARHPAIDARLDALLDEYEGRLDDGPWLSFPSWPDYLLTLRAAS